MAGAQRTIRLRFTGDSRGLTISAKEAETSLDKLQDKVTTGFPKMAGGALKLASALATVSSTAGGLASVGAALATMSGIVIALPGAIAGYAAILGTIALGAAGIEKAVQGINKTLDPLKAKISSTFEQGLRPAVADVNKILPQLGGGLDGIAIQLTQFATQATKTVALPENMKVLKGVLGGTEGALDNLKTAVAPLTQAFIDVVSVAVPGMSNIGSGAGKAAEKFAAWIRRMKESGELKERLDAAVAVIKQIGAMFADLGGIVAGVFRGISAGAGGVGGTIAPILNQLNEFINSTQGQAVLSAIGAALAAIGQAFTTVLGPALTAVTPLLPPLLLLFSQIATIVANNLVPIIQFLAPILLSVANFIQQNVSWLAPLAVGLGAAAGAMWLLNAAMNANPIMLVITLLAGLVAAIIGLWQKSEAFRNFFTGMWNGIKSVVGSIVDWIRDRWNGLVDAFNNTVDRFRRIGEAIGNAISSGVKGAINFVIGLINGFIRGVNLAIGVLNRVPGVSLGYVSEIPKLARGGRIDKAGLAMVGERGRELVHLPGGAEVSSNRDTEAMLRGGAPEVHVYIGDQELRGMVRVELKDASDQQRRRVGSGISRGAGR